MASLNNGLFLARPCVSFFSSEKSVQHVSDWIFKSLDKNALIKCRLVSNIWKGFVDCQTSLWKVSPHQYIKAAQEGNLYVCHLIIQNVQDKNPADAGGWTPLHEAAKGEHIEFFRLIIENVKEEKPTWHCPFWHILNKKFQYKNPANSKGQTPLHFAAKEGHMEVCQLIMENFQDKNPGDLWRNSFALGCFEWTH